MEKIIWRNEKRKLAELNPATYNPRQLTEKQAADLAKSLERFALADPIVINANNTIIGGHQRINILRQRNPDQEVDVRLPSRLLSAEEEQELNIRLNKNLGEWDFDALANFDEALLKDIGFSSQELDRIFELDTTPEDDDAPAARTTDIKAGDIFQLGEHRLICGDSTKQEDITKLFGDEKVVLCLTDPPYSVNYKSRRKEVNETLASYQDTKDAKSLLRGFMSIMPTDVLVMTYADKQLHPYVLVCEELGFETIDLLIWVKQNFCFWPGARYQQKHELVFLTRRRGGAL